MKTSILHITNGDATTQYLQKLGFDGDYITWREMLCEGKTTTDVGSENFWKTRYDFLKDSYKISKKKFIDFTLKEYRNLCQQKSQDEIMLWFEYDLFCQINMLAVVSWLKRYRKGYKISLIQSGKVGKRNKLHTISELSEAQLNQHFKNRVELTQDDIEYADYIWQLYCSDSPLRLETVHKFNPMSPFVYLEDAIRSHLLRFPSLENGLNSIENNILLTSQNNKFDSKEQLVGYLLKNQGNLGFSDVQYFQKINELRSLFHSFNPVNLRKKTKEILERKLNYYGEIRNDFTYLGGARKYSYLYVNANDKLLKITS